MAQSKFVGKVKWPVDVKLDKGLEGAITNATEIGYVDGQKGKLFYRGYDIFDLADKSTFEETAFLLLFGKLPSKEELETFNKKLVSYREIPEEVINVLKSLPKDTHPMAALRTGISILGCLDNKADQVTVANDTEIAIKLISRMASLAGAIARIREGKAIIAPNPNLPHAANLYYMMTGKKPDSFTAKTMEVSLILHADHGMNASTFTCMIIASSLSDLYSAIVGGIGSLKGPLHGGANERALSELLKLRDENDAVRYVKDCIVNKKKIMGFGHRVYKTYDPRAKILDKYVKEACEKKGLDHLYKIAKKIEEEVITVYGKKGIFPNVDFYSGILHYCLGIDPKMFTPIFAVTRVVGWCARVLEYLPENRIFRPRAVYIGPLKKKYIPIEKRK